jgi:hypothetical protein
LVGQSDTRQEKKVWTGGISNTFQQLPFHVFSIIKPSARRHVATFSILTECDLQSHRKVAVTALSGTTQIEVLDTMVGR